MEETSAGIPGGRTTTGPAGKRSRGSSSASPSTDGDDDAVGRWLDAHLKVIHERITKEAQTIANSDGRGSVEPNDIAQAALLYTSGHRILAEEKVTFRRMLAQSITGVTIVSAVLVIAFGIIGLLQLQKGESGSGAFDIAKIFAGAIVGSTGGAISANRKRS